MSPTFAPKPTKRDIAPFGDIRFKTALKTECNWNDAAAELGPWDCGRKVGPATPRRPGLEVRMYDRETVELALYALDA